MTVSDDTRRFLEEEFFAHRRRQETLDKLGKLGHSADNVNQPGLVTSTPKRSSQDQPPSPGDSFVRGFIYGVRVALRLGATWCQRFLRQKRGCWWLVIVAFAFVLTLSRCGEPFQGSTDCHCNFQGQCNIPKCPKRCVLICGR